MRKLITIFFLIAVQACGGSKSSEDINKNKLEQTVIFSLSPHVEKTYGDEKFTNLASAPGTGTISYQSSDNNVASVDSDSGEVTIHTVGKAQINASITADEHYQASQSSYQITVNKATPIIVFHKVPENGFDLVKAGKGFRLPFPSLYVGSPLEGVNFWDEFQSSPDQSYQIDINDETVLSADFSFAHQYLYEVQFNPSDVGEAIVTYTSPSSELLNSVSKQFTVSVRNGPLEFKFTDDSDKVVELTSAPFTRIASGGHGTEISYTSSMPDVVSINRTTGEVTIKGIGESTITAVSQGQGAIESDFDEYSVKVTGNKTTPPKVIAWIGQDDTELSTYNTTNTLDYVMANNSLCQPDTLENCEKVSQGSLSANALLSSDITLTAASTIWLKQLDKFNKPQDISASKFAPGYCRAKLVFNERLWLIAGRIDESLNQEYPVELGYNSNEVWSSVDGLTWKLEVANAAFPPMSCPEVFVFQDTLWLVDTTDDLATKLWSSSNGINWHSHSLSHNESMPLFNRSEIVLFNNKLFLYHNSDGCYFHDSIEPCMTKLWSSPDAVTWQQELGIDAIELSNIVAFQNILFSFNNGFVWTSDNAINWNKQSRIDITAKPIVHKNKLWRRESSGGFDGMFPFSDYWSSEDGYNWAHERAEQTSGWAGKKPFLGFAELVSFKQQLWLIEPYSEDPWSSTSNAVIKSYDGRAWQHISNNLMCKSTGYQKNNCSYVVYKEKFWQGKDGDLYSSEDGLNWKKANAVLPTSNVQNLTVFNDRLWLIDQGSSWSSNDGITWLLESQGQTFGNSPYENIYPFSLGNELLLLTKENGNDPAYWRSNDGKIWHFTKLGQSDLLKGVQVVHDGKLWSLTENKVSYSLDGLTWQEVSPLEHEFFKLVSFQQELWAFGLNTNNTNEQTNFQQIYKLNEDGDWELITERSILAYHYHWSGPSFFREKSDQLYYFSQGDSIRNLRATIWKSNDAINWRQGHVLPIQFDD